MVKVADYDPDGEQAEQRASELLLEFAMKVLNPPEDDTVASSKVVLLFNSSHLKQWIAKSVIVSCLNFLLFIRKSSFQFNVTRHIVLTIYDCVGTI